MPRHLLADDDLDPQELVDVISSAASMADDGNDPSLVDRKVALLFEKPSTRTRVSFECAVINLGGHPIVLSADDLQLSRGESIEDTGRVLSSYVDCIVVRTHGQDRLEALAGASEVPVVNALSAVYHPCQAISDLLTIQQVKRHLPGVALAYVGDGNNMAHSLMLSGAAAGVDVRIATPDPRRPDDKIVQRAEQIAAATGGSISVGYSPLEAVAGAEIVYTDVWESMGDPGVDQSVFNGFQVDEELLERAANDAMVMHCLPAHRGLEIAHSVLDGPRSIVWTQAANRIPAQMAILESLLV